MTTQNAIEAYPLCWPDGRPRTPAYNRVRARFHSQRQEKASYGDHYWTRRDALTMAVARDELLRELDRLGVKRIVISTNVPLRQDGLPYSNRRAPDDPGVAVYFTHNNQQLCFACDRWDRVEDNVYAVAKTIDALRGIARWGTGDMIAAAFRGFKALPAARPWHQVLGVKESATAEEIEEAYRMLAMRLHPDRGGSQDAMAELNAAMGQIRGRLTGGQSA